MSSIIVAIQDLGSACASEGVPAPRAMLVDMRTFCAIENELKDHGEDGFFLWLTIETNAGPVKIQTVPETKNPLDETPPKQG